MQTGNIPPVRRRLVGGALRRHREDFGYTLEDAAKLLDCDRSKISRIETGQRGIRPKELRELLDAYGTAEPERETLAVLTDPRRTGWWEHYLGQEPAAVRDFLVLESFAGQITVCDTGQVPELLQTEDYARAVAVDRDPHNQTYLAEMILARQHAVMTELHPQITAIIGEAALHAGDPAVLSGQIGWLAKIAAACPHVTLRVLPAAGWAHALTRSPATLLGFPGAPTLGAVYLPGLSGGVCLTGPGDVTSYTEAFAALVQAALDPAASSRLLQDLAERSAVGVPAPQFESRT